MKKLITIFVLVSSIVCLAGPKEDFMKAVSEAAKKNPKCSEVKPTPGRQGTVMKWKTCSSDSVTIDGCILSCSSASSEIGG